LKKEKIFVLGNSDFAGDATEQAQISYRSCRLPQENIFQKKSAFS